MTNTQRKEAVYKHFEQFYKIIFDMLDNGVPDPEHGLDEKQFIRNEADKLIKEIFTIKDTYLVDLPEKCNECGESARKYYWEDCKGDRCSQLAYYFGVITNG